MEEVKTNNPTNWGQGTAGAGVITLAAIEAAKGVGEMVKTHFTSSTAAQAANAAMALEMAKKDSEISLLKANAETDKKMVDLFTVIRQKDAEIVADNKVRDKETADLKAEVAALKKDVEWGTKLMKADIDKVATLAQSGIASLQGQVMALNGRLDDIVKTVIPIDKVCPTPMLRYNSWTQPTTPAAAA